MVKRCLILLLISSVLQAQGSQAPAKQSCPDERKATTGPGVTVNQRHDLLRRGRAEDFAVVPCSPTLGYGGCGFQTHPPQSGIVPLSLSIDLPSGLTTSYRKGRRYVPLGSGVPARFTARDGVLLLRFTAGDKLPLGVQQLHGTMQYETVEPGKPRAIHTLEVDFQLTVAAHNAKGTENDWPYGSHVGRHLKDAAMVPLIPFEFVLLAIACSTSTCDL